MDKASIIKDAINYIQELHEQERRIQAEISELESMASKKNNFFHDFDQDQTPFMANSRLKKKKIEQHSYDSGGSRSSSPIQVIEVQALFP